MARALLAWPGTWALATPCHALKLTKTQLTACTCSCCEASQSFLRFGRAAVCTPLFSIAASSCPAECNDLEAATAMALHSAQLTWTTEDSAVDYARFCLKSCSPPAANNRSIQSLCTPSGPSEPSGPLQVDPFVTLEGPALPEGSPAPAPAAAVAPAVAPAAADAEGQTAAAMAEAKVAYSKAMAAPGKPQPKRSSVPAWIQQVR
eukprot:Skav218424  [mRNA]  locus=scaffold420:18717:20929:- [translate_table: standard]